MIKPLAKSASQNLISTAPRFAKSKANEAPGPGAYYSSEQANAAWDKKTFNMNFSDI